MSQNNPYSQSRSPYGNSPYGNPYQGGLATPPNRQPVATKPAGGGIGGGIHYAVLYVVAIWAVHIVNVVVYGGLLSNFGIHPLDPSALWGIFTAPLLHASWDHLISNTVPGAIFAFFIGMSGSRVFWQVTAFVVIIGGLGTWLIGGVGTNHIGASGMVYGWLVYLLVRGIFNKSFWQIIIGFLLGVAYSGLIWGVLPGTPGVSWQAHLCGSIGGFIAAVNVETRARKR